MEKDHDAARLRSRGLTYKAIGERLGMSAPGAFQAVQRAIADIPKEATEEIIALEMTKLDNLEARYYDIMEKHHAYVSASGKVAVDFDGQPIEDDGPVMQAMAGLLKVADRRAKLLGLNAPTRTELTGVVVTADLNQSSEKAKASVLALLGRLKDGE
jgi:hypothetical protein